MPEEKNKAVQETDAIAGEAGAAESPPSQNETGAQDEAAELRAELERMRQELAAKEVQNSRMLREMNEFSQYFPERDIREIPETVWSEVSGGTPLAAAYALFEHKSRIAREAADKTNRQNEQSSAGALRQNSVNDFYSSAEVRAMNPSEIRKNYDKIVRSMPRWRS